jgi:hypothetical protein
MDISIDVKCAVTTAILSVLIFILLISLFKMNKVEGVGKSLDEENTEWFKSMEVLMLLAVFLAFNLNTYLFTSCKTA